MRQFLFGLSISIAFIVGCVTAQHVPGIAVPSASASAPTPYTGQRWEYTCEDMGGTVRNMAVVLNLSGAKGWELAAFVGRVACFKRPL